MAVPRRRNVGKPSAQRGGRERAVPRCSCRPRQGMRQERWARPGTDLGSAHLAAPNATRGLQGAYRCTADNGVGAPLIKEVNIAVHEPAHFGVDAAPRNVSGVRGLPVTLECDARGDAPLSVLWTHRGVSLQVDSFRWKVSETRAAGGVRSTLQLRAAGREDAGEYGCRAHNHFGSSERIIFLHVEEPPEAPSSIQLAGASSRWIRVRWRARVASGAEGTGAAGRVRYWAECTPLRGDSAPSLNLTLEAEEESGPDSQGYRSLSALVAGVRPAAAYAVRLLAANRVGQSPRSEPLLVTILDEGRSTVAYFTYILLKL
ncbi:Down syndrome cell adhesion molecule-like protein CG42256 [Papilio xuthus]|uniref:Down syndrome cell adhesion molecule-like protein CG42256 n=1 Tax=Papilio xuthus TaxID=66420 RepID=A0A194PPI0_PAPXU|nr:Down syndrome cell adhesion molecule-like protein CG42256 [Papilio xuthus]